VSLDDALVAGGALLEVVHGGRVTYEGRDEMSLRSPVAHQRESDAAVGCGMMTIRREAVSPCRTYRWVAILGESERPAEDRIRKVGHLVESAGDAGVTVARNRGPCGGSWGWRRVLVWGVLCVQGHTRLPWQGSGPDLPLFRAAKESHSIWNFSVNRSGVGL
jgi:hypothetical protein